MKKLTWILCLLLVFVLISCPSPGENIDGAKTDIVIKVRNSDILPEATKISIDVYCDEDSDFNFNGIFDKAEGEFTEIPMSEEFKTKFLSGNCFAFNVDSIIPDVHVFGADFVMEVRYKPGYNVYILDKPRPMVVKVRNADLPEDAESFKCSFIYEGNDYSRQEVPRAAESEFTVIPTNDHLADRFRTLGSFDVKITGMVAGRNPIGSDIFYTKIDYSPTADEYIIERTGYVPPYEKGDITVSIKPGTYMEEVSFYSFTFKPVGADVRTVDVPAEDSGNTVLLRNAAIEDGSEYTVAAMHRANGGPYPLGEYTGMIAYPKNGNEIVLDPMEPYGRIRLEFDAPFWHFSESYSIDGVRRTRRWDKICPEYVYLPPGNHELSDISCTGVGNLQSQKTIKLEEEPRLFIIASSEEIIENISIGNTDHTSAIRFCFRGGTDYKVKLYFESQTEGFDEFHYNLESRDDFVLPHVPDSTHQIYIDAQMGNEREGKYINRDDFVSHVIAFDFAKGQFFIPEK